ncbi:MAG: HpcH/HpaI aldolase family protein [Pararhodobacter sp.]
MTPPLRARLKTAHGKALRGPFLAIPSPMVAEIACAARPDFVCIDMEHGPVSYQQVEDMIRAADLWGVAALVRVRAPDPVAISQVLDAGAAGVLVPRVSSVDEARLAVAAARFLPEGRRGVGPGRASGYGRAIPAHLEAARTQTLVAVQIETVEALDDLPAILSVPGIDLAFIGPGDLAISLTASGREMSLEQAIDTIIAAAAAANCPVGIFALNRAAADAQAGRVALVICGSDSTLLIEGFGATFGP